CINESANARGEAVCVLGALPLPRSLTRCARSFG
ncbi:SocE, partial [Hymenobacter sp. UV11]